MKTQRTFPLHLIALFGLIFFASCASSAAAGVVFLPREDALRMVSGEKLEPALYFSDADFPLLLESVGESGDLLPSALPNDAPRPKGTVTVRSYFRCGLLPYLRYSQPLDPEQSLTEPLLAAYARDDLWLSRGSDGVLRLYTRDDGVPPDQPTQWVLLGPAPQPVNDPF